MIEDKDIVDNYEIKISNKLRDDSLTKFCNEYDTKKIRTKTINVIDEDGKDTGKTKTIKEKFDFLSVVRSAKGELQAWQVNYKVVE